MVTALAVDGSVYVLDAIPLLLVVADGVPKLPPAPPSLNVTTIPAVGLSFTVASTLSAVGNIVPTFPLCPFPALTERTC
jgi:hypothetical protein